MKKLIGLVVVVGLCMVSMAGCANLTPGWQAYMPPSNLQDSYNLSRIASAQETQASYAYCHNNGPTAAERTLAAYDARMDRTIYDLMHK